MSQPLDECNDVDCHKQVCMNQCGSLQTFVNASECTVRLEARTPFADLWYPIGAFAAGEKIDTGPGAIYFPEGTGFRVVDLATGKLIKDLGKVAAEGRVAFVLSDQDCQSNNPGSHNQMDPASDTNDATTTTTDTRLILIILACVCSLILIIFSVWILVRGWRNAPPPDITAANDAGSKNDGFIKVTLARFKSDSENAFGKRVQL